MGDSIRMTGRLTFTPPLTWSQYRDVTISDTSMLMFEESVTTEDTDDGQHTVRCAVAVVPRYPDRVWGKGGYLEDQLAPFIDAAANAGSRLEGYLYGNDGSPCDLYRFRIEHGVRVPGGRVLRSECAIVAWPDGTAAYVPEIEAPEAAYPALVLGTGERVFGDVTAR